MCRIAKADCGFIFFLQNQEREGDLEFQANSQAKRNHGTFTPRIEKKSWTNENRLAKHDHLFVRVRPFCVPPMLT